MWICMSSWFCGALERRRVERASGESIVITLVKSKCEYTRRQRRKIDARLAEAAKSPIIGPFDSVEEMRLDVEDRIRKMSRRKTPRPR